MPNPPDTAPRASSTQTAAHARAAAPTLRSQVVENPLMTFFCLMIIALLSAAIASPHIRINDTNARIDRLDVRMTAGFDKIDARFEKVDARFEKVDARFDELEADIDARFEKVDARFDELELKLTALIAVLGATDDVNAIIEGHLGDPAEPAPAEAAAGR